MPSCLVPSLPHPFFAHCSSTGAAGPSSDDLDAVASDFGGDVGMLCVDEDGVEREVRHFQRLVHEAALRWALVAECPTRPVMNRRYFKSNSTKGWAT